MATRKEIIVAIIGGSGADKVFGEKNIKAALEKIGLEVSKVYTVRPKTILGLPEGELVVAELKGGGKVVFMARHGQEHNRPPSGLRWGANILALKELGVTHVLVLSACGSLSRFMPPGTIALISQYIDMSGKSDRPFTKEPAAHVSMADPTCLSQDRLVIAAAQEAGVEIKCTPLPFEGLWKHVFSKLRKGVCCLGVSGPDFSTRAESKLWRLIAHVVGMSINKEARWARAAGMHYTCIGLVCDFDAWHKNPVNVEMVESALPNMVEKAIKVFLHTIRMIFLQNPQWNCGCHDALKGAVQTSEEYLTEENRTLLKSLGWTPPAH